MGFKDAPWDQRLALMGDQAEKMFEETYPKGWARYGLRRPPIRVDKLPALIRYTPDYITTDSLVEVMGVGGDQTLKLKVNKLSALSAWHLHHPVDLYLWDSHKRRHGTVPYMQLLDGVAEIGTLDQFPEGHAYWGVDVNDLLVNWHGGP